MDLPCPAKLKGPEVDVGRAILSRSLASRACAVLYLGVEIADVLAGFMRSHAVVDSMGLGKKKSGEPKPAAEHPSL